ncbi:MAG: response regulator [Oscillatoriales cyanobacterium SM2_2_1]|nr:response regulator [Oscillatoriales cyanobacterium SM2_2_1]
MSSPTDNFHSSAGAPNAPQVLYEGESIPSIPAGQVLTNLNRQSLLAMLELLQNNIGIARVNSAHLCWNLFITNGTVALIEETAEFIPTLQRKLKLHKTSASAQTQLTGRFPNSYALYRMVGQIYEQDPEATRTALKEVMLENLLALFLEDDFTLLWQPAPNNTKIHLPIWKLGVLVETAQRAAQQWQQFQHLHHPYQTVQLIDDDNTIAQIPLFIKMTTGKHRITQIADSFQQPLIRTAIKLEKLAQEHIVAVLPLSHSNECLNFIIEKDPVIKVMIVDDSPLILRQFRDLLDSWGYAVVAEQSAANAVFTMLEHDPKVVFLDLNMPEVHGFELLKQIRRHRKLSEIPIVILTAENSTTNSFRAKWAHCRFLSKPRTGKDTSEFRQQLRELLREVCPLPSDTLL